MPGNDYDKIQHIDFVTCKPCVDYRMDVFIEAPTTFNIVQIFDNNYLLTDLTN